MRCGGPYVALARDLSSTSKYKKVVRWSPLADRVLNKSKMQKGWSIGCSAVEGSQTGGLTHPMIATMILITLFGLP